MPTINGYWRFSPDRPETRPHKPATTYPQELSTSRQRHACCRLLLTDVDRPLFLETDPDNIFVGHKLSAGGIPRVSAIAAVNRQPRSTRTGCRLRQPRSTRTGCRLPTVRGDCAPRQTRQLRAAQFQLERCGEVALRVLSSNTTIAEEDLFIMIMPALAYGSSRNRFHM